MEKADFYIGGEFWCDGKLYRCTDIGSRVIVGIRVDKATVATSTDGVTSYRTIDRGEAERLGWFNGPPYGVIEIVFDEDDLESCSTREF